MKLRIRGNSIRLRLTRSEVEQFRTTGRVEESVDFGEAGQKFSYALEMSDAAEPFADYDGTAIRVLVPREAGHTWADSEQVGITSKLAGGPTILVEKDFACLQDRPGETEDDAFPNPDPGNCAVA